MILSDIPSIATTSTSITPGTKRFGPGLSPMSEVSGGDKPAVEGGSSLPPKIIARLKTILSQIPSMTTTASPITPGISRFSLDLTPVSEVSGGDKPAVEGGSTLPPKTMEWLKTILSDIPSVETTATSITPGTNRFGLDLTPMSNFSDFKHCVTAEGHDGLCVAFYQCKRGVIDNDTLLDLRDGSCPSNSLCCSRSDVNGTQIKPPVKTKCGWGNPGVSGLRINDQNFERKSYADFGEFPWMIALMMRSVDVMGWSQKLYLGGGTLIHPSVVITAAHKVTDYTADQIKCRAGEWDTQSTLEVYPHQDRDVKKIIIHDKFYITVVHNDISMLVLEKPFDLDVAPHIGIACLGAQLPPPGTKCCSMGWGQGFDGVQHAVFLKKVEVPYVPLDVCEVELKKTKQYQRFNLHNSHICAGGIAGIDNCKGDGGSPLVCPIEGPEPQRYAVYGLVAFGAGCGNAVPAVYVNIPQMHSWVDATMTKEGFVVSTYRP